MSVYRSTLSLSVSVHLSLFLHPRWIGLFGNSSLLSQASDDDDDRAVVKSKKYKFNNFLGREPWASGYGRKLMFQRL